MDAVGPKQHVCVSKGSSCCEFPIIPLQLKQSQCVFDCWVVEAELYRRSWGFNWGLPAAGPRPIDAISLPVDFLDIAGLSKRTQVKRSQLKRTGEDWQAHTHTRTHTYFLACFGIYTIQMPTVVVLVVIQMATDLSLLLSFFSYLFPLLFLTRTCTRTHSRKWVAWLGDKAGIRPSSGTAALSGLFSISPINSSTACSSSCVFFLLYLTLYILTGIIWRNNVFVFSCLSSCCSILAAAVYSKRICQTLSSQKWGYLHIHRVHPYSLCFGILTGDPRITGLSDIVIFQCRYHSVPMCIQVSKMMKIMIDFVFAHE